MLATLRASFTTTYLTLTSIIQGVALAYLVSVVDEEMHTFRFANWLLVVTTFLAIVAAWYEYMNAVTVFVWIPRLRDALIPFLLGGSELALIRSLRSQTALETSYLAFALLTFVVLAAFLNMYSSAASEGEPNRRLLEELIGFHRFTIAFVAVAGVSVLAFAVVEAWAAESTALDVATAACCLAFVVAFLVRGAVYWGRVIEIARRRDVS
jgi:hypothetical protein